MKNKTEVTGSTDKKATKKKKGDSALAAASVARSATGAVSARSTSLSNEGTNVAYEEEAHP